MYKWLLPTLSEVLEPYESADPGNSELLSRCVAPTENSNLKALPSPWRFGHRHVGDSERASRQWCAAITATQKLLFETITLKTEAKHPDSPQGLVFTGPLPALSHPAFTTSLHTVIFTGSQSSHPLRGMPFQLLPATVSQPKPVASPGQVLPLMPGDPLATEQFCLVLTSSFSLVVVLGQKTQGEPAFMFSFEPEVIEQAWKALQARIALNSPYSLATLETLVKKYGNVVPDYRTVMKFSRWLLKSLAEQEETKRCQPTVSEDTTTLSSEAATNHATQHSDKTSDTTSRPDVELLQAFAHEVRTPLTTIRTLTRLLLKRRDLSHEVIQRLQVIDHECTEQIDRMELLFKAAELETSTVTNTQLTAMSLAQVLQQSIPRWQQSANRRNLTLDVMLPQHLPSVVSHPLMLDQMLTGLIENFTRSLPPGSHIQVQVIPAGDQLKLQLLSQSLAKESDTVSEIPTAPSWKSLGQLLTFQPETGNICLNLTATKHLFQAIGGKLIVRQRPHQGEVLTIFLPQELGGRGE